MSTFPLPVFPLPELIFFPGTFLPLHIFEPRYRSMLSYALENGNELGIACILEEDLIQRVKHPKIEQKFGWGQIIQVNHLPDGRSNIIVEGLGVCELQNYESMEPFRIANVHKIPNDRDSLKSPQYLQKLSELLILTKRILLADGAEEELIMKMNLITKHPHAIDFLASLLHYELKIKQKILETQNLIQKSEMLLEIVSKINLKE